MRERAATVGGTLRTGASPTGGFVVEAVLPTGTG
jgi:signal transduction histidine kinase